MGRLAEVIVPDLNGADSASVIEVVVAVGEGVSAGDHIITVETEKTAIEVLSPFSGPVKEICVKVGDQVVEGDLLLKVESSEENEKQTEQNTISEPVKDIKNAGGCTRVRARWVLRSISSRRPWKRSCINRTAFITWRGVFKRRLYSF